MLSSKSEDLLIYSYLTRLLFAQLLYDSKVYGSDEEQGLLDFDSEEDNAERDQPLEVEVGIFC